MARSRNLRLWLLALWSLCLLATSGGQAGSSHHPVSDSPPPAAVAVVSAAADPAVLPPRATNEVRSATQGGALRVLVLAAVLAALVGLPAMLRRTSSAAGAYHRPLAARRYAIAVRAPPLQFA